MNFAGNLKSTPLSDVLRPIADGRKTGVLHLLRHPFHKKISCRDGEIRSTWSNDPRDSLAKFLVRDGRVTEEQIFELLQRQEQEKRLVGSILVADRTMSEERLKAVLVIKAEETLYDLFLWPEGRFEFHAGPLPDEVEIQVEVSIHDILLEGARRIHEWVAIKGRFPFLMRTCLEVLAEPPDIRRPPEKRALLLAASGKSLAEVAVELHWTEFETAVFFRDLCDRGVVRAGPPTPADARMSVAEIPDVLARAYTALQGGDHEEALRLYESILAVDRLNHQAKHGLLSAVAGRGPAPARAPAAGPAAETPAIPKLRATLEVRNGPGAGRSIALPEPPCQVTIGSASDCNVVLDAPGVELRHARIAGYARGFILSDSGSQGGVFVSGRRVEGSFLLNDGDEVTLGALDDAESARLTVRVALGPKPSAPAPAVVAVPMAAPPAPAPRAPSPPSVPAAQAVQGEEAEEGEETVSEEELQGEDEGEEEPAPRKSPWGSLTARAAAPAATPPIPLATPEAEGLEALPPAEAAPSRLGGRLPWIVGAAGLLALLGVGFAFWPRPEAGDVEETAVPEATAPPPAPEQARPTPSEQARLASPATSTAPSSAPASAAPSGVAITGLDAARALGGTRVLIRGSGFSPDPAGNLVTFGGQTALVLTASPSEIAAVVPVPAQSANAIEAPVVVQVRGRASSAPTRFTVLRSFADPTPLRFFPVAVHDHPGHEHVFVATDLGPALLVSGRGSAPTTAERAFRLASALNEEVRRSPRSVRFGGTGAGAALPPPTDEDVAGYAEPWSALVKAAPSREDVAAVWTAVIQDYRLLFRGDRPTRLLDLTPRADVLQAIADRAVRRKEKPEDPEPPRGIPPSLPRSLSADAQRRLREAVLLVPPGAASRGPAGVAGAWEGTVTEPGGVQALRLVLRLDGSDLVGEGVLRGSGATSEGPLEDLVYQRGTLRFRLGAGGTLRHFSGAVKAESMAGSVRVGASGAGRFALRLVEAPGPGH